MNPILRNTLIASAIAGSVCGVATGAVPDGRYAGKLSLGPSALTVRFEFGSDSATRALVCRMDSPDQGVFGLAAEAVVPSADSVEVAVPAIGLRFCGNTSAPDTIRGTLTQNGYRFPLVLVRSGMARPQTPVAPFPYTTVDTVFTSPKTGISLAGTLTLPEGFSVDRVVPAVVMVTGSGLQNRDEEIFGHRPFLVIADWLARNGIASLRYDDRGFAKSGGDGSTATTLDFKDDAEAALEFLRSIPGISAAGILGHSEGGTIAMMLGGETKVPFAISLAGVAVPMKEVMLTQNRRALTKAGLEPSTVDDCITLISATMDAAASGAGPIDIDSLARERGIRGIPQPLLDQIAQSSAIDSPWLKTALTLDPTPALKSVRCPLMAVNGEFDTQVDAATNLTAVRRAVPVAFTKSYPGLNHLFQHCATGELSEYAEIEETISPEVLDDIVRFIRFANI